MRNQKLWRAVMVAAAALMTGGNVLAETGLFYAGTTNGTDEKVAIQILKARIYAEGNENTDFAVYLETTDFPVDPKTNSPARPIVLRVGDRIYPSTGSGGSQGHYNVLFYRIHGEAEAKAAAEGLSTKCGLRAPPGYKFSAQFNPAKPEFRTNEPVLVKFKLKDRDERTMAFQRGGQQRGFRDNQYGFRAMLFGSTKPGLPIQPVADVGNPVNYGGLSGVVTLEPGQTFDDQVDLKKWFAFDKAGTYQIHGFYSLAFHTLDKTAGAHGESNVIWHDYASADFVVVIK